MSKFTNKEINKLSVLVKSRQDLYNQTDDIRSMFESSKKMYSDDAAFLLELIQNADDSNATIVNIVLSSDNITFEHNGELFSISDIDQITKATSESNSKKNKPDKIGKFGIGFKSVFNVTDRPTISSGKFDFAITNFIIPEFISPAIESEEIDMPYNLRENTLITLPFIDTDKYSTTLKGLEKLTGEHILFLNHIREINITINSENKKIYKEIMPLESFIPKLNEDLKEGIELLLIEDRYYLVCNDNLLPNERRRLLYKNTKIAFELREDYTFLETKNSKFHVYFPTNTPSGLPFHIQGNYTVGMNRKELNNYDQNFLADENNMSILEITIDILCSLIELLADNKKINLSFLNLVFKNYKNSTDVVTLVVERLIDFIEKSDKFILHDQCNDISKLCISKDKELIKIINATDIIENTFWIKEEYLALYPFLSKVASFNNIDETVLYEKLNNNADLINKVNLKHLYEYVAKSNKLHTLKFIKTTQCSYESYNSSNLYCHNEVDNIEGISQRLKKDLQLEFNPQFIDLEVIELLKSAKGFEMEKLTNGNIIDFIDQEYFKNHLQLIKNTTQYFAGFNIILELIKLTGKMPKLNFIIFLTTGENNYIKRSTQSTYYLKDLDLQNLYLNSRVLEESNFIDTRVYDENIPENLKGTFESYLKKSGVRVSLIEEVFNEYNFDYENKISKKLFSERKQPQQYIYKSTHFNPTILGIKEILNYLSSKKYTENKVKESIALFRLITEFFNKHKNSKPYFEYHYNKLDQRVYLDELDLYTPLRNKSWIWINNKQFRTTSVSAESLVKAGYIDKDYTSIKDLLKTLDIQELLSKTVTDIINKIEFLDDESLILIKSKVDEILAEELISKNTL